MENFAILAQLSQDYSKMCLQNKYSDVTLVVADEKIPAHKNILAARSCYFEEKLDEPTTDEIVLKVSNIEAFKILLKYIYTGCIACKHLEINMILTIFLLSRQYFLNSLEESLSKLLKTKCNIENVVTILNFARANQIQHLIDDCETFIDANSNEILAHESSLLLSEESVVGILKRDSFRAPELTIFKFVVNKWSQNSFEKAKKAVNHVRLSLIPPLDICKVVAPTGFFDYDAVFGALDDSLSGKNIFNMARGLSVFDRDLATSEMGAKFLSGEVNSEHNYRYHEIPDDTTSESSFVGIMVELKEITAINNIRMLLWDIDDKTKMYSYYIEVSTDQDNWTKVIDYRRYFCRSLQDLYFETCAVKYINIVGTYSHNTDNEFRLVNLETYCKTTIPGTFEGIVCPTCNVASLEKGAVLWQHSGDNDACLDGNYTNYNETEGYTTGSDICIRFAQPYIISYIKFLLLDCDNRTYDFKIETFSDSERDQLIANEAEGECKSWQTFYFDEHPVNFVIISATKGTGPLRIVHFECMYKSPEEGDLSDQEAVPE